MTFKVSDCQVTNIVDWVYQFVEWIKVEKYNIKVVEVYLIMILKSNMRHPVITENM